MNKFIFTFNMLQVKSNDNISYSVRILKMQVTTEGDTKEFKVEFEFKTGMKSMAAHPNFDILWCEFLNLTE